MTSTKQGKTDTSVGCPEHRRFWPSAVALTVCLGPIPIAIAAGIDGTLLPSVQHSYPLIASLSVMLGDTILLPWVNGVAMPALVHDLSRVHRKTTAAWVLIAALVLSVSINLSTHIAWIRDEYTGYMDSQLGQLAFAGWWHLVFSILQMALVFVYAGIWLVVGRRTRDHLPSYLRAFRLLVVFTGLGVLGAFVTKLVWIPEISLTPMRIVVPMLPLFASIALLGFASKQREGD